LAAVERTGSISEAARSMAMSYRRAWVLIAGTNQLFGRPVVAAAAGGRRGGGASLTPFGRSLLARFRRMEVAAERATRPDRHQLERWIANKP
jgi:molybdate transport system regulatory protein